jgi:hypothetical protein
MGEVHYYWFIFLINLSNSGEKSQMDDNLKELIKKVIFGATTAISATFYFREIHPTIQIYLMT